MSLQIQARPKPPPRQVKARKFQGPAWRDPVQFGAGYLALPGLSGQGAWTPDSADFDVLTGDLQIIACVAFNHVTTKPTIDNIITKGNPGTAGEGSWAFRKAGGTRTLQFSWRESGGTIRTVSVVSSTSNAEFRPRWHKLEFVAATATGTIYISDEPPQTPVEAVTWALHGSDTDSVATDIALGSADIWLGNRHENPNEWLDGKLYYVELRDGIGGNILLNPDFRWQTDLP